MKANVGTRTISITSGKGGVGKTTLVCNLAVEMARAGKRVLILDGDLSMSNVDIMFGTMARLNLGHVLSGDTHIQDILLELAPNVHLVPGGSGVYELTQLRASDRQIVLQELILLQSQFDVMLVDTAPGIDDNVLFLNAAAQEILVVLTPDPSSLTDAYALIKVLHQKHRENRFSVVVNMAKDEVDARMMYLKLSDVSSRFLNVSLEYKGFVPIDLNLRQANRSQQLVSRSVRAAPSAQAIRQLADKLGRFDLNSATKGGLQFFWHQVSGAA
jgi:flagellar biosynthesis protein FlhG